jgi:hypothetical protein
MLHQNFAHFIGQPIQKVQSDIEEKFFGTIVVYTPTENSDPTLKPSRLKVFVDDQGIISRIVNG